MMSDSEDPENSKSEPTLENVNPQSIEGLFLIALEKKTPEERAQFLDEMCGDNVEQRRRVEALLMAYDDAGSFLEKSPVGPNESQPISLDFLTPTDNPDLLGTLGEYEIYEKIGQGGMGIVFRALDRKLNRIVAIKVMSPLLAINPNARKRFLREAQAAAAVSHPHIVTIHAVDEDKLPYLVMECVSGHSLQEKLDKDGSLQVTEILRIGQQIAEGLAAAHKQGLIHRDIKPANILLENGIERVKITDFGLARATDDVTITKTGEVSGTPQYMSPEQAKGERVDQRSDLFSLGAVLYAMCTGRSPFRASNLAAVVRRVCDDLPRKIEEINEEIPPWLIEVVDCLLEKRPGDRFQTASQVADLLGAHLAIYQQPNPSLQDSHHSDFRVKKHTDTVPIQKQGHWGDRLAIRAGSLMLFVPFVLWGIGASGGGHFASSVEEMVFISVVFCVPAGLLLMVCGAQNMTPSGTTLAKVLAGLFLIACILAGPLGLLLYIARYIEKRDAHSSGEAKQRVPRAFDDMVVSEQRNSNNRVLIGVSVGFGLLMILWMLSSGWGHLQKTRISILDWFVISLIACGVVGGFIITWRFFNSGRFREMFNSPRKAISRFALAVPLLILGFCSIYLLLPMYAKTPTDVVIIDYDRKNPITEIELVETGEKQQVHSHPALINLKPGRHTLKITYRVKGNLYTLNRTIHLFKNMNTNINISHEVQDAVRQLELREEKIAKRNAMIAANQGAITLQFRDTGLKVGVFPIGGESTMSDEMLGYADRFSSKGPHVVPAGKYNISVYRKNAGWVVDEPGPHNPSIEIEVKPGEIFTIEVSRDFRKVAERHPDWSEGSKFEFVWPVVDESKMSDHDRFGVVKTPNRFTFSKQQALVVQQLLKKYADRIPEVVEAVLLATANGGEKTDKIKSMFALFDNGKHPAWNTLVIPGKIKGTWRLVEPKLSKPKKANVADPFRNNKSDLSAVIPGETKPAKKKINHGSILLDIQDQGLRVGLYPLPGSPVQTNDKLGYAERFLKKGPHEIPAGIYSIKVCSLNLGWSRSNAIPTYDHSLLDVKEGQSVTVSIKRDYHKLAQKHPDWSKDTFFHFRWPEVSKSNWPISFVMRNPTSYKLSKQQAMVVQQLFNAFADGNPEVTESDLLAIANQDAKTDQFKSMSALFENENHPAWNKLIIPGKTKGTWRLIEPEFLNPKKWIQRSSFEVSTQFSGIS